MKSNKFNIATTFSIILLFISIILITITATSTITSNNAITEKNMETYLDDALNEITSYLKIRNVYGSFSTEKPYHLTKIAIIISPLFHDSIEMSDFIIQLQTKNSLTIYTLNDLSQPLNDQTIFTHTLWKNLPHNQYSLVSIIDKDTSIEKYQTLNEPSDLTFLVFSTAPYEIKKGDLVTITISSGTSIHRTITFETPLPTNNIVSLW